MRAQVKQKIKTLPEKVYINPGSVEYEQMLHDFQRDIAQCDNDYIHESYLKRKDNKSYNYDYYDYYNYYYRCYYRCIFINRIYHFHFEIFFFD